MSILIKRLIAVTGLLVLLMAGINPVFAKPPQEITFTISPQSTLTLNGNSTLHRFSFKAEKIDGSLAVNANAFKQDPLQSVARDSQGKVVIPVKSLDSGEKGLDKNMRKAMKAKQHPEIVFTLHNLSVADTSDSTGNWTVLNASGVLQIAGTDQLVQLRVQGKQIDHNELRFSGSKKLEMTDFGIKPPKLMLGAIKTDNEIEVDFNIIVKTSQDLALLSD